MKGRNRHPFIIAAVLVLLFSMACTFSTMIPTPVPPTAEAIPSPVPQRPQSSFIDGRTTGDDSSPVNTANDSSSNSAVDNGGSGAQSAAQASGGQMQTQYQVLY